MSQEMVKERFYTRLRLGAIVRQRVKTLVPVTNELFCKEEAPSANNKQIIFLNNFAPHTLLQTRYNVVYLSHFLVPFFFKFFDTFLKVVSVFFDFVDLFVNFCIKFLNYQINNRKFLCYFGEIAFFIVFSSAVLIRTRHYSAALNAHKPKARCETEKYFGTRSSA
ncbi:hypothetical protein VCUG_01596 [Vavraia culicis subsp. floridensis]|uniref:Uncharacterized protein n=1 Tax=Vavraia culicis (isolate floridensis) TaxID=948595 RepID=L2GUE5_VAVCU|nr:uncharacterized protein VCUG_01596 [Vavraia culicis subsp. floridensis]ELA46898.1 hypothetical protein VCUG_01596 [Vavraia culicis subsp. floridensis]